MLFADLSLDRSPPLKWIIPYFLTAPIMAALMGIALLFWDTDGPLQFRSVEVVALTHLFTLGFITMTMIGAMLQMLPVMAGSPITHIRVMAPIVHATLTAGLLAFALLFAIDPGLLLWAATAIYAALTLFAISVLRALAETGVRTGAATAMRLAAAGLLFGASAGLALASIRATGYLSEFYQILFPAHLIWMLFGWIATLLMGVSVTLIPMFYVTPRFPATMIQRPALYLSGLCLIAPLFFLPGVSQMARLLLYIPIALTLLIFGLMALRLISRRGRKIPEQSIHFWRSGTIFLILSIALFFLSLSVEDGVLAERITLLSGVLFLYGGVGAIVQGMVGRIVPFLSWLDLFTRDAGAPNVKKLLPDSRIRLQFVLHLGSVAALSLAIFSGGYSVAVAGAAIAITHGLQFYNLLRAAIPALTGTKGD